MTASAAAASVLVDVSATGAFVRKPSVFRNFISSEPGAAFPPAAGRYLLYVSLACPWACRCLSLRSIKGLEDAIDVAVVAPIWSKSKPGVDDHEGWAFDTTFDDACTVDPVFSASHIRGVYEQSIGADEAPPTRFTVPILFDKLTRRIVNNESSEIIRFFNSEFNAFARFPERDMYPAQLRAIIDATNDKVYESINNGVYKCGFAQSQGAYDDAVKVLFATLEEVDQLLSKQRFLTGPTPTESDVRLFVCLVRFDEVYVVHFKCAKKAIREFANLPLWLRDVYQTLGLAPTVNMRHIKSHYFGSHRQLNPFGIVPISAGFDLSAAHGRDTRSY